MPLSDTIAHAAAPRDRTRGHAAAHAAGPPLDVRSTRLLAAPPGDQRLAVAAGLHALDIHLDGATAAYAVLTERGARHEGQSIVNSFCFLPAGEARRIETVRSGRAVRVLFGSEVLGAAAARPILHAHDGPLLGAARIADAGLAPEAEPALVSTLLLRLRQLLSGGACELPPVRPADIQRVLDHVDRHIADRLTLGDLAAVAGISQFHLARRFRGVMGCGVHAYVVRRRLDHAAALIGEGRDTLADIAYAVGFGSQSHMTTTFRKHRGTTPGALRRG